MKEVYYKNVYRTKIKGPDAGEENGYMTPMRGWIDCSKSGHGYRRYYLTTGGLRICLNSMFKMRDPDPEEIIYALTEGGKGMVASQPIKNRYERRAEQGYYSKYRLQAMEELAASMRLEDIVYADPSLQTRKHNGV